MFLGEYYHTIDSKGRVTVPSVYRDKLQEGCVFSRGWERYLIIYSNNTFLKMANRSQELSPTVPEHRVLQRVMFASAREGQFDKLGRVNIPAFLRAYAGLDKEVVLAGVGGWIEVWNKEDWEIQLHTVNDSEAYSARFDALNLAISPHISDVFAEDN